MIAFAEALKDHLRRRDGSDEAARRSATGSEWNHQPSRVAGALVDMVVRWQREGRIDGWGLLWLDGHVKSLDGYLRRLRADPQHAALVIVPGPAPPWDRPLPRRSPRSI